MKKLTKLTALALALALVLGMTAMAGTPSEILLTDSFEDAADLSWSTFGATRSKLPKSAAYNYGTFAPVEGYNKYYYNNGAALNNVNGRTVITDATQNHQGMSLLYTVPDGGWALADANDGAYALVAQMGWIPADSVVGGGSYGHIGFSGPIATSVSQDGATTTSKKLYGSIGFKVNEASATSRGNYISFRTGCISGHEDFNMSAAVYDNEETVIRHVVRNAWRTNETESENEVITEDGKKTLNMISYVGRSLIYSGRPLFRKNPTTDPYITSFDGFWFASHQKTKNTWTEFVMYKLSLDRNDFLYETASMKTTDIAPEENMEIIFNQPISITSLSFSTAGNMVDIRPKITVTTGEGDDMVTLTYGEDYTIEVSERVVGTAIKGIMTIKPLKDWAYATDYTVKIPNGIATAARISMRPANNQPLVFTTVAAPEFAMTLDAYKGLAATGTALTALEAGTTYFAVSAIQSEGIALTNGTVRIEILDAEGNVVKYATAKKEFGATAATFGAAFKLEADQTARAFVVGVNGEATID